DQLTPLELFAAGRYETNGARGCRAIRNTVSLPGKFDLSILEITDVGIHGDGYKILPHQANDFRGPDFRRTACAAGCSANTDRPPPAAGRDQPRLAFGRRLLPALPHAQQPGYLHEARFTRLRLYHLEELLDLVGRNRPGRFGPDWPHPQSQHRNPGENLGNAHNRRLQVRALGRSNAYGS